MSDIFCPPSLSAANAVLSLADSLTKLLDPKERAKIIDDIKTHHALNDAEAKKHAEASSLIKQNQDILDETKRLSEKNKADAEMVNDVRIKNNADISAEHAKLKTEKETLTAASQDALALHRKAEGMINSVARREEMLRIDKEAHAIAVKKLNDDTLALEEKRKGIEKFQQEVSAMDNATKAKVEKLKQFNF